MRYHDRSFSLPTGRKFLLRQVVAFVASIDQLASLEGGLLVDVGCGHKPYEKLFRRYRYLGVDAFTDISSPDVAAQVTAIPIRAGSVDACMTVWVLDDLSEPEVAIKELSRILKTGGHYFAVEAQWAHQHFPPHDYFRFAPNALAHLCKKHALELVSCTSYGGDFAVIGFSLIHLAGIVNARLGLLGGALTAISHLVVNCLFAPLDRIARLSIFHGCFETNSVGYCYVFRKLL